MLAMTVLIWLLSSELLIVKGRLLMDWVRGSVLFQCLNCFLAGPLGSLKLFMYVCHMYSAGTTECVDVVVLHRTWVQHYIPFLFYQAFDSKNLCF